MNQVESTKLSSYRLFAASQIVNGTKVLQTMKLFHIMIFYVTIFSLPIIPLRADQPAELQPMLVKPGELMAEDSFDAKEVGKHWNIKKGTWEIEDGILVGKEKEADKHNAVLNYNLPNRNSMIRFSFKLDGTDYFALSFDKTGTHLFRVVVSPDKLAIIKDRDKKNPQSRSEPLAAIAAEFEPGKWHMLQVEILGDQVAVQSDNNVKLKAKHASLDIDKPNYRFVVGGKTFYLDNVKVWKLAE